MDKRQARPWTDPASHPVATPTIPARNARRVPVIASPNPISPFSHSAAVPGRLSCALSAPSTARTNPRTRRVHDALPYLIPHASQPSPNRSMQHRSHSQHQPRAVFPDPTFVLRKAAYVRNGHVASVPPPIAHPSATDARLLGCAIEHGSWQLRELRCLEAPRHRGPERSTKCKTPGGTNRDRLAAGLEITEIHKRTADAVCTPRFRLVDSSVLSVCPLDHKPSLGNDL